MSARSRDPGLFDEAPRGRTDAPPRHLSVSELTAEVALRLGALGRLSVEGELSGIKRASSGHVYFDLKDKAARISCVVWSSQAKRAFAAVPKEGDQVLVHGKLDVYAPRGSYSLVVERVEAVGVGLLLARLEALKVELAARGWFERRRPLPAWPRPVGVVTSRDGAALRDFLRTRSLRWPGYPVRIAHAPVQGPGASAALGAALTRLSTSGVDVVVLIRGGGSLEDLMAFNEEPLLTAMWNCPVPIVSGVGHETDTTLADLVADVRAHTPTDAASRVLPDRAALLERLERLRAHLVEAAHDGVERRRERLERAAGARVLSGAGWLLSERQRTLEHLSKRLAAAARLPLERRRGALDQVERRLRAASPRARVRAWQGRTGVLGARLVAAGRTLGEPEALALSRLAAGLHALSPLAVLARGYSLTFGPGGEALRDAAQVAPGDSIATRLSSGVVHSRVEAVEPKADLAE